MHKSVHKRVFPEIAKCCSFRDLDARGGMKNGEGGIRTPGALSRTLVFETSSISHSDTSPEQLLPKLLPKLHPCDTLTSGMYEG